LGVLEKILDDENAPAGVRVDAAKTVLDRAGFAAARKPEGDDVGEKSLHEMSMAELEEFIKRGYRRLDVLSAKSRAAIEGDTAPL